MNNPLLTFCFLYLIFCISTAGGARMLLMTIQPGEIFGNGKARFSEWQGLKANSFRSSFIKAWAGVQPVLLKDGRKFPL